MTHELDDDVLFDPLLSDEPLDLPAIRQDDALVDALNRGDSAAAAQIIEDDPESDPLIVMLCAWVASVQPDPVVESTKTAGGSDDGNTTMVQSTPHVTTVLRRVAPLPAVWLAVLATAYLCWRHATSRSKDRTPVDRRLHA